MVFGWSFLAFFSMISANSFMGRTPRSFKSVPFNNQTVTAGLPTDPGIVLFSADKSVSWTELYETARGKIHQDMVEPGLEYLQNSGTPLSPAVTGLTCLDATVAVVGRNRAPSENTWFKYTADQYQTVEVTSCDPENIAVPSVPIFMFTVIVMAPFWQKMMILSPDVPITGQVPV